MRKKIEKCTSCKAQRGKPHKFSCRYSLGLDSHQSYTYVYESSPDYGYSSCDSSSSDSGSSGGCDG